MRLLNYIQVKTDKGFADIELYQGDLSAIPKEFEVDIVILSAYPNDYTPTTGTLIGALHQKGLSVEELSKDKEMDLRRSLSCWFSKQLPPAQRDKFHFQHILCFEPVKRKDEAAEYVADIFRCLNNFVFDDEHNHVAMTTVAAGNQSASAKKIAEAILEAAVFWLQRGLPLHSIKLVEIDEEKAKELNNVFEKFKQEQLWTIDTGPLDSIDSLVKEPETVYEPPRAVETIVPPRVEKISQPGPAKAPPIANDQFDIFISYAHKNKEHVQYFIESFKTKHPSVRLFYDSETIPKGGQWLKEIARCIDRSNKVLVFLSREFDESPACWDEFQCAKVRQNRTGKNVIMNIYLHHHPELPTIFEIFNWIDCREGDRLKLEKAIDEVIGSLDK
jgi:hypothetical protein